MWVGKLTHECQTNSNHKVTGETKCKRTEAQLAAVSQYDLNFTTNDATHSLLNHAYLEINWLVLLVSIKEQADACNSIDFSSLIAWWDYFSAEIKTELEPYPDHLTQVQSSFFKSFFLKDALFYK